MEQAREGEFAAELKSLGITVVSPEDAGRGKTTVWFFGVPSAGDNESACVEAEESEKNRG